jgi:hypothetical protein
MTLDSAAKIARIHFAKVRWERATKGESPYSPGAQAPNKPLSGVPDPAPMAVELPAEELAPEYYTNIHPAFRPLPEPRRPSDNDKFLVVSSDEYPQSVSTDGFSDVPPRHSGELVSPGRRSDEQFSAGRPVSWMSSAPSWDDRLSNGPPRPPKTPLQDGLHPPPLSGTRTSPPAGSAFSRPPPGAPLPYPDTDGPPPIVNKATKPDYTR